jgi:hypothetical protein
MFIVANIQQTSLSSWVRNQYHFESNAPPVQADTSGQSLTMMSSRSHCLSGIRINSRPESTEAEGGVGHFILTRAMHDVSDNNDSWG